MWRTGPVVVTGAGGHVGRAVRARLAGLPNEVRPVDRGDDLEAAVDGAEAVIHLAGALQPRAGETYEDANVATARRTVDAVRRAPVVRPVLLSYPGADPASPNDYLRSKGRAEGLALGSGREGVVVRSTFIFGPPDDPGPSAAPFISSRGRPVAVVGSGRQRYAPVHVADVAEALVHFALDPGTPTGTFGIAGPREMSADAFVDALNGGHAHERHLRRGMARALAHVSARLTPAMVDVLSGDSLSDGAAAADRVLGLRLRSLAETYPTAPATHAA